MSGWSEAFAGRDVVIVSPQFWGDYWVSKHWIAYELSRRCRTLFIEPTVWVGGLIRQPWVHRAHWRRVLQPIRALDSRLHIVSPKFFPGVLERRTDAATQRILGALRRLKVERPIVLNFGTNHELVKRMKGAVTVYYCVDPAFPEPGHERDEELTVAASDLVYAVSETYRRHLAPMCTHQELHVIPHGYAFEHARRIAEDPLQTCPKELAALPRPILGFVGSIHDAYVDIDRVEFLARSRPNASIALIGPYQSNPLGPDLSAAALQRLRRLPNVHLLGPRHFLDVPRYIKHFDAALVLVNVKDFDTSAKTSKRTHFKWLAYLAMGKPVVAPAVDEADAISSLVYLVRDDAAYLAAVDAAVTESRELAAPRIDYASQFAFGRTLDCIALPISRRLQAAEVLQ